MHVIVVGCGRVGAGLASSLVEAGHSVAIIDRKASAFNRLPSEFPAQVITGIGFDRDRLGEAGIERADALAAVTNGDNSNILIARVARETFKVERVVARIYDPRRAAIFQRLGIPTVATVSWATERVLRRILPEHAAVDWVDPSAKVCLVERTIGVAWAGHHVSDIEVDGEIKLVAVSRLGSALLPSATTVLQDGDVVYVAVAGDSVSSLDARLAGPTGSGH